MNSFRSFSRTVSPALCLSMISAILTAQEKPTPVPGSPAAVVRRLPPGGLKILVLEGRDIRNSIKTKSAVSPVVQVLDSQDQPVQGATVTFEVPPTGPGGTFAAGAPLATARTDYGGQATAAFTPNNVAGTFFIRVSASLGDQKAEARIRQINDKDLPEPAAIIPPKAWYKQKKWWAVLGAAAGGGIATGIILAGRNDPPTVTISPAPIGIGGPR